jgi:predicted transcriptional regulator YdeE
MNKQQNSIQVIGIELRTTNDNGQAFHDIPLFWERFMKESCASLIPNKLNNDIYAVYTNFENEGINNKGMYSLIIGCNVPDNTIPPTGFTKITIPEGYYRVFSVENGRQDKVGAAWQSIWAIPDSEKSNWRFHCEFERYRSSGEIDIFIGLNN